MRKEKNRVNKHRTKTKNQKGGSLNWFISHLPFEAHIPGYQYCGPGTRLKLRLKRGDKGINQLDAACKLHDIAYHQHKGVEERNKADRILRDSANAIANSASTGIAEQLASKVVAKIMDVKQSRGL